MPPLQPMLARSVAAIPVEPGWLFEPKWDGFRCIVFRDGDEVQLASRSTKPLTRYFPDVAAAVLAHTPRRCVLDGELIVDVNGRLEFELLGQRIHPAQSRVRRLAAETPARFVAFDLVSDGESSWLDRPLAERRKRLEAMLGSAAAPIHLTRTTTDPDEAELWFRQFEGAGLDGVVAKRLDGDYRPNVRSMLKIKHERTADVVVAGYRLHKTSTEARPLLGALLLGLYDDRGRLQHVGVASAFSDKVREAVVAELQPLVVGLRDHPWGRVAGDEDRIPGAQSRWTGNKDLSFIGLEPVLVAEVGYEHMEGTRFRHTAKFRRWRPDRDPDSCTYAQLEEVQSYQLADVLL